MGALQKGEGQSRLDPVFGHNIIDLEEIGRVGSEVLDHELLETDDPALVGERVLSRRSSLLGPVPVMIAGHNH